MRRDLGVGSRLPRLQGSYPLSSRPGLSPHGAQVGTCGVGVRSDGPTPIPLADYCGAGAWGPELSILRAPRAPGSPASWAWVHQGGKTPPPLRGSWPVRAHGGGGGAAQRPARGEGGKGGARGQVGRGGLLPHPPPLPPWRNSRSHPPACTHQPLAFKVLPFSRKEEAYFILFFYS